jgi:hypothetical protein
VVRPYYADRTQYLFAVAATAPKSQVASPLEPAARERHGPCWLQFQRKDWKVGLYHNLSPAARSGLIKALRIEKIAAACLFLLGPSFYHYLM